MGRHRQENPRFRLLFVCTGNICRSPFAEILTRHLLNEQPGGTAAAIFDVSSAGVRAVVGAPMHPITRAELAPWGLDGLEAERFVARQLSSELAEQADLVLGASRRHRSAVVEGTPDVLARTFSLREFARLASGVDPRALPREPLARAHALVELARLQRGLSPSPVPDGDDVADPMGGLPSAHHVAAELIAVAVETIIDVIAPGGHDGTQQVRTNGQ